MSFYFLEDIEEVGADKMPRITIGYQGTKKNSTHYRCIEIYGDQPIVSERATIILNALNAAEDNSG